MADIQAHKFKTQQKSLSTSQAATEQVAKQPGMFDRMVEVLKGAYNTVSNLIYPTIDTPHQELSKPGKSLDHAELAREQERLKSLEILRELELENSKKADSQNQEKETQGKGFGKVQGIIATMEEKEPEKDKDKDKKKGQSLGDALGDIMESLSKKDFPSDDDHARSKASQSVNKAIGHGMEAGG